ncbi:DUF3800 domain-containing protein [Burkholderia pseudomallei]|uniref:DUF3800 domain-containing protein n=1 Tax=Burkholderia pseudomallei TaxID=28450 RepID=UPI000F06CE40|nr:DUF3800 domain-containing protein [Burkholderia pseudomallei]MBD2953669.1 DUF3800 domain-containing protein [Burkholderia pseudomallei]MBD2972066.1 DUF3800 domain-containing protein [Burkholderia pseudomallei]MCW0024676.1 DUF3800 domain-containing protein [Burkholderia pseudomallei]MCW0156021.1 DUF3800 domain-containing protein [Burkholderia pseudomallei]MCW0169551.1 DUF3800 domain-containing protein [Burkholderia pseudomallei]
MADPIDNPQKYSDYIVFVDESGSPSLGNIDPDFPLLVLAFMIIRKDQYMKEIVPAIQAFKLKHFGHDQIILHEREIRRDLGSFSFLKTRALKEAFIGELSAIMSAAPFHLVAAVIRKDRLQQRYKNPANPYHLALQYGLERVCAFLRQQGDWKNGSKDNPLVHLIVEQRGKNEDNDLELEFRRICDGGNYNAETFAFDLVFANKQSNSSGLQLADLVARPVGLSVVKPDQENRAMEILREKLVAVRGQARGWGLKVFP